jgi:hypothetical protein
MAVNTGLGTFFLLSPSCRSEVPQHIVTFTAALYYVPLPLLLHTSWALNPPRTPKHPRTLGTSATTRVDLPLFLREPAPLCLFSLV